MNGIPDRSIASSNLPLKRSSSAAVPQPPNRFARTGLPSPPVDGRSLSAARGHGTILDQVDDEAHSLPDWKPLIPQ